MARPAGAKPKPTAVNKRNGNPGKRRINREEPQYEVKVPKCPSHMDPIAKKEWRRIGGLLASEGLLTDADMAALMAYCRAFSLFVEADKKVQQYGPMLISKTTGSVYQSPYVHQMTAAAKQMVAIATEFGLTPSSRTRVNGLRIDVKATMEIPWDKLTAPIEDGYDPIEELIIEVESKAIEGNGNGQPKIGNNGNGKPKGVSDET